MNLDKTRIVLKKINRLYELIQSFGEASNTEKDLLKAYILDLYEAVVLSESEEDIADREIDEMKERLNELRKQEKKLKKQLEKKNEELEQEEEEEEEMAEPDQPVEQEEEKQQISENNDPEPGTSFNGNGVSEEMKELFEIRDSAELSDKLANSPIKDLTKAMGINEKIFTVNELFDGNREEMDTILNALNGLSDFEEAKSILVRSVAAKYNWTEAERSKKAKSFIKLVRRRYIA